MLSRRAASLCSLKGLPVAALLFASGAAAQPDAPVHLRVEDRAAGGPCIDENALRLGLREMLVRDGLAAAGSNALREIVVRVTERGGHVEATRWTGPIERPANGAR